MNPAEGPGADRAASQSARTAAYPNDWRIGGPAVAADDDAAAAPVADLDGRAKLLVSKQVSFMHRNQGWANPEKFSANPGNMDNYF